MSVYNGVYRIKNAKSGTYLDASVKNHPKVHGWSSRPENNNQKWRVQDQGGLYTLQNLGNNEYLHIDSTHDGTGVRVAGHPTRWNIQQEGDAYAIIAENSSATVDLHYGESDDGTPINVWGNSGARHQRWKFEQLSGEPSGPHPGHGSQYSGPLPPAPYFIRNVHTGTALDLSGALREDGSPVIGYHVTGGENQKWVLEPGNRGYRIRNASSGSYLSYRHGEQANEATLLTGNNRNDVEWDVRQSDRGYQIYLAGQTHLVLDLASGDANDGAKICLWSNKNGANQKWDLLRA